jgi:hypothetical protein
MSFRGRIFTGSLSYPQDASRFLSIGVSLGATFTTSQIRALAYLVNNLTDLGIGAVGSNFVIYPFIGGSNAATNALNLFFPEKTENNLTFVGSPTHSTSGVTFNGTTQYAYGQSLALYPMTPDLTMANVSIGLCVSGMGSGTYIPMGIFSGTGVQTKTYSTAGSSSFNFNLEAPQFTSFTISAWGGGGAGGGSNATSSNRPGGGGAGGGYATRAVTLTGAQLNTALTITVGAAGTANSGAAGGAGGDSIVTHPNITTVTAKGGPGGNVNTSTLPGAAVAGAAGNAGTTTFVGGAGAAGGALVTYGGGGGGSSAGTAANGGAGSTPTSTAGGAAGTAPTGGANGGAGGLGSAAIGNPGNPGFAGGGGGGGGGATNGAPNNQAGGAGGAGKVTVAWAPTTFRRVTMAIFNSSGTNNQQLDMSVDTDNTSRFSYQTTPNLLDGVRVGSRRANNGNSADMGLYVQNNAGSAISGPAIMSTTSFSQTPVFFFGAANSWANSAGVGNTPTNFLSGTLNFSFMGPGLSNTQLQALYTLITTYNGILGR